ncbi:MAG: hypothetical protein ACKOBG_12135 [Actinomycetota bacterium]
MMTLGVFGLIILVLEFVALWVIFTKIGMPGWMGIVPILNYFMVYKARGVRSPLLWTVLYVVGSSAAGLRGVLLPALVLAVVFAVARWFFSSDLAEMFGKGVAWKVFIWVIPGLAALMLAFGDAKPDKRNIALAR